MESGIFSADGKIQSGWISNTLKGEGIKTMDSIQEDCKRLIDVLKGKKLCVSKEFINLDGEKDNTDLTRDILYKLTDDDTTDVLIEAENGEYQAILIGTVSDTESAKFYFFFIDYLCSVVKGKGAKLLQKLQRYITETKDNEVTFTVRKNSPFQKTRKGKLEYITLLPAENVEPYYRNQGFEPRERWHMLFWTPGTPIKGGRRKTRRRFLKKRKTRRRLPRNL